MVIGLVVGIACIIAMVLTLYFCRCYKWGHETNDIFKDVDKDLQDTYKEAIPAKPIGKSNFYFKISPLDVD